MYRLLLGGLGLEKLTSSSLHGMAHPQVDTHLQMSEYNTVKKWPTLK